MGHITPNCTNGFLHNLITKIRFIFALLVGLLVIAVQISVIKKLIYLRKVFNLNHLSSKKKHLKNLEILGVECKSILQSFLIDNTANIRDRVKVLLRDEKTKFNITNNRDNKNVKNIILL